jgi:heat-inducible transcriptional repressor
VSSRALARETGLDLSPATIRNIMADLEEMGLISAPHTSAGRIPTSRGYRLFVDALLTVQPLDQRSVRDLEGELGQVTDPQQALGKASSLLSNITHLAGLVTIPRRTAVLLRQIEFVPLGENRVLVILVTTDGQVQNRVVNMDRRFAPSELTEAANYFNATYGGQAVRDVRRTLLEDLERDSREMNQLMATARQIARQLFTEDDGEDLMVSGEDNLFDVPELCDLAKLRGLFDAFKAKQDLLQLLDRSMRANHVHIFIGDESGYSVLQDCSVVTAPYKVDGQVIGTLGVIGPTRMSYDRVIPLVDVTARLLGSALKRESS